MFTDGKTTLRELVDDAVEYLDRCDHDGAAAVLAPIMARVQPADLIDNELLVHAVITWARTAVTPAQARKRGDLAEAAWVQSASVYGNSGHPRCLVAGTVVADVQDRYGDHIRALRMRDIVVGGWHDLEDESGIASSHADRAGTLHRLGRCGDAIRELTTTLARWQPHRSRSAALTQDLIADLVQMLIMCGRDDEAATTILEHHNDLPAVGSLTRHRLALTIFARLDWEARGVVHAKVCARQGPADLAGPFPPKQLDPWEKRRHRLFTLFTGTTGAQPASADPGHRD